MTQKSLYAKMHRGSSAFRSARSAPNLRRIVRHRMRIEFFALLGPNGAGKTAFMRIICGRVNASYKKGSGQLFSTQLLARAT